MNIPLVDLKAQYREIKKDLDFAVSKVLKNGNFILGKEVGEFEEKFAKFNKVKYCLGLSSGYDAITLSLKALGIGVGDEVITVANTFIATVFPIIAVGAKPVLVDMDPKTYLIDINKLEEAITKKTRVIIPVHLFGRPCRMNEILKIAKKHKLLVIEDAAQAHGASISGKKCGTFGDIGAFSFYPGKNLGALGDGGAIVTNNKKLYEKIKIMRDVGQIRKYYHENFGYNSRLDTIHAAALSVKLGKLNEWNKKRVEIAKLYNRLLAGVGDIVTPGIMGKPYFENFHLFVIQTKKRDLLIKYLEKTGIHCGIHYPIPVHLQKATKVLGYGIGDFPETEKFAKRILSLPIYPQLKIKEVKEICKNIRRFYGL
jgi:dTDP-4-amino-4,6-dideoxygalactose transaminase